MHVSIRRVIKHIAVIIEAYHFCQLRTSFIQHPIVKFISICTENTGDHQCGFRRSRSTTDHMFCIRQILEKKWEYNEAVHQPFVNFKEAYDSVRREVFLNILMEFVIPRKLLRLLKMCLNETRSRVRVGKHLSDIFPINSGLKQGDALLSLLFNFTVEYVDMRVQVNQDG